MTDFRKLIKFGTNSIIITLPKDWIKANKLQPGASVRIEKQAKQLIIRPEHIGIKKQERLFTFTIDEDETLTIKRKILHAYLNNCDFVILKGKTMPKKNKIIRDIIHQLVALEIIEETATHIQAQCYLNMEEIDILSLIRKIDNIIKSMFIDIIDQVQNPRKFGTMNISQNIIERDWDVNRLCYLLMRKIKYGLENPLHQKNNGLILDYWDLIQTLETIGDQIKRLSRLFTQTSQKEAESLIKLIVELSKHYNVVIKAYHQRNFKQMHVLALRRVYFSKAFDDYQEKHERTIIMAKTLQKAQELFYRIDDLTAIMNETKHI